MKIAFFSHTYLIPENRKNLSALAAYATVYAGVPNKKLRLFFCSSEFAPDSDRVHVQVYRSLSFSQTQYFLLSLTLGLLRHRPDIVVVDHNPWSAMFLQVYLYRMFFCRKAKLVCSIKKNTYRRYPGFVGFLKDWWARFTLRRIDHVIAVSDMVMRLYRDELSVPASRISKSRQLGVDTSWFKPAGGSKSGSAVVIGYCGRFDADKGVTDLVEAVRLIRDRVNHPVKLKLLGDGSLREDLQKTAQGADFLEILPLVPNEQVAHFLQGLDIFVLPSWILPDHQEHDGHALMEALSCGVAAIGTRAGIIPEMLGDGTGALVDAQSPEQLAVALAEWVDNPEARKKHGRLGREKAEKEFALDVIARRKMRIFEEIYGK